jgi:hypothetical protein
MPIKRVLRADRLRRIPAQFSWIDHRLVREHYIERCDARSLALYLFVLTVADAQGLSFYGEASLCRALSMSAQQLAHARATLMRIGLIAYERPLYQVLSLEPQHPAPPSPRAPEAIGSALARVHRHLKRKAF